MSEELKPCPFCNGEAQRTESSGLVSCAFEECPAFLLAVPADNWNRRAQPAEAEGVDFGFDDRSVKVSQEAYSIFLARERHHLAALSAVTAERDRLRAVLEGAQYPNIDRLKALTIEQCRQVGETVMRLTIDAQSERDQLRAEVEASRLLLEQCNEVIAEDGGVYIELRAFLAGTMPASDVIALLRDAAMAAKEA